MDNRALLLRLMRKEFGNLLNSARIKVVTINAVDLTACLATVQMAQGDPVIDVVPDTQDVGFLDSYTPIVGQLAYMLLGEGAPILIGPKETEVWHNLTLPTGYTTVSPYHQPAYRLDNQGRVWFKGVCNVAASNAAGTKFTMPVGYRTLDETWIAVPYSNGTAISGQLRYDVNTDGTLVTLLASPAATQVLSFEGVSYDTRP